MVPDDVPEATAVLLAGDFGDRRTWFEFATTQAACRPVVATLDEAIVGTGVGTANGAAGWIGTIWVTPALRGHGLGRALTQAVIDALEDAGCVTLLLVATDAGRRLYERMGFAVDSHYRILEAPPLVADGDADLAVRPFRGADLEAVCALDRAATGEDRRHAIERFATAATAKLLEIDDVVRGFVVRAPWGGGATIASEPADALRILEARRRGGGPSGRVRAGLLDANEPGLALLEAAGWRHVWSAPRMIRGRPFEWRPGWIWGQLNHAIG